MQAGAPRRVLSLFDSTCLIVGIIVGAGIYQTAPEVARGAGSVFGVLAIWTLGGVLSLCGALGYAELAAALPRAGGDAVYLSRAYGPWAGFLFGWLQVLVVRPGDIAVMSFAFATYARVWFGARAPAEPVLAIGAVVALTAVNLAGVRSGKWTQNVLTTAKVLGLLIVIGAALAIPPATAPAATATPPEPFPLRIALILVLFTFGGWNEMAYVAGEVRDYRRNLARALILGTAAVTVLYLLANIAFLGALGWHGVASSHAVAVDAVAGAWPAIGARIVAALVCVSALGAVSGLIFAGARIAYAVGLEHRVFRPLGRWSDRTGTPVPALIVQAVISIVLILALRSFVETVLYTAAAVYLFYLATSLSVIVLRRREPALERPFRVPGHPWPTVVFAGVCVFLIHAAVTYRPQGALVVGGLMLLGAVVYRLEASRGSP
jgi:APA family basic amino acid/polyamine antiporter